MNVPLSPDNHPQHGHCLQTEAGTAQKTNSVNTQHNASQGVGTNSRTSAGNRWRGSRKRILGALGSAALLIATAACSPDPEPLSGGENQKATETGNKPSASSTSADASVRSSAPAATPEEGQRASAGTDSSETSLRSQAASTAHQPAAGLAAHTPATAPVWMPLYPGIQQELRDLLATLDIKGRAPKAGYTRDQFGQRWRDIDHNGCDQRNDVLARDLTQVSAPKGCRVLSGVLDDPYTGQRIMFQRGQETSALVQIDHVVALADAWQKGAQYFTPQRREEFANDPMNLLAVDGTANMNKSAGDAATWLPQNKAFRCAYVGIQIRVKATYGLWVTQAEHDAMARELGRCP